jgi:hypothetical protein
MRVWLPGIFRVGFDHIESCTGVVAWLVPATPEFLATEQK